MALSSRIFVMNLPNYNYRRRSSHESLLVIIRAQSCKDEGRSRNNIVDDENLRILECRVAEVREKEKIEKCYHRGQQGWNYYTQTEHENRRRSQQKKPWLNVELVFMVGWTFGLTILSGTLGLCLVAIFVHAKF